VRVHGREEQAGAHVRAHGREEPVRASQRQVQVLVPQAMAEDDHVRAHARAHARARDRDPEGLC